MAKKAYVVFQGKKPGIYYNWNDCKASVDGFKGAIYKGYETIEEAKNAYEAYGQNGSMPYSSVRASKAAADNSVPKKSEAERILAFSEEMSQFFENNATAYEVHTDGGANPNPGYGGFGYVVVGPDKTIFEEGYGAVSYATNNQMELMGAIYGLQAVPDGAKAVFMTDSTLVYAGLCENLDKDKRPRFLKWQEKGWVKSDGAAPENLELVQKAYSLGNAHSVIGIPKPLKATGTAYERIGHVGRGGKKLSDGTWEFPYNKICDKLAEMGEEEARDLADQEVHLTKLIENGQVIDERAYLVHGRSKAGHGLVVDVDGQECQVN